MAKSPTSRSAGDRHGVGPDEQAGEAPGRGAAGGASEPRERNGDREVGGTAGRDDARPASGRRVRADRPRVKSGPADEIYALRLRLGREAGQAKVEFVSAKTLVALQDRVLGDLDRN